MAPEPPPSAPSLAWRAWNALPEPARPAARALIGFARRLRARNSSLPPGPRPPLPDGVVELRTRYGGFWFDASDHKLTPWIERHATWEQDVGRLLEANVRPGMVAVDVGANVGFHTATLARLVGPGGTVHAFEPLPMTVDLLRANLWRHGCANTTVHETAVSDHAGTVELALDPEGRSGAFLGSGGITVPAVTLDDVLAGRAIDVLKVDVEGAEPLVLRGARNVLASSPALLAIVEFRNATHLDGSSPDDVLELYAQLGLRLHLLGHDGRALPAGRDEVLAAAAEAETINLVLRKP